MFKWISSIQSAIKDARVNRKGPGRRRQDKFKGSGQHTVDGKHNTAPPEELKFEPDRIEPVSILHCEQRNRPRGPQGRRLPGRKTLHSTTLNASSIGDLSHSSGDLLTINESTSLESSTELTGGSFDGCLEEIKNSIKQNNQYQYQNHRKPRTITTDTVETDDGFREGEGEERELHYDSIAEESNRRIIGIMNKMKLDDEEDFRRDKSLMTLNGLVKSDNHENQMIISKANGESNGTVNGNNRHQDHSHNHHHNTSRLMNGKTGTNGYSTSTVSPITPTSPSPLKIFQDKQDSKDLRRQLNAIFSNNNQHNQQFIINLGDSTVSIDQTKLTSCLKEIYPTLLTSGSLLSKNSSMKSSLTDVDCQLRSVIKEIESLKDVKKSKTMTVKLQSVISKLINLADDYSKSIESFDNYDDQITKLIGSLLALVSQSSTSPHVISPDSPSSLSPSSSPRLVNLNKKLYNGNSKSVNSPSSTHC